MALLLPKRRQILASPGPMGADIIMNFFVLEQMCLVSVTNVLLSDSRAPAGCRRASRVQAGRPGAGRPAGRRQENAVAHRMYSDVRLCARMCPLFQDKKSAVQV